MLPCEKQTLRGQRDMKGVFGSALAVHSVIVCVSSCVFGTQMDYNKVTWKEEKTRVVWKIDFHA